MSGPITWLGLLAAVWSTSCASPTTHTEILKWPEGKRGAVSLTYDGGTINQFDVAVPIMNRLGFPATFFIVTGDVTGSSHTRTFIGRPAQDVAEEVKSAPTDATNLFERAGAMRVLGYRELIEAHTRAGDLYELGRFEEAFAEVDSAYAAARRGEMTPLPPGLGSQPGAVDVGWDELRSYAEEGHEFASHSVSHAQLAILDEPNLRYELEKSREEIVERLGVRHGFSVECPYGTENERVVDLSLELYEATRNRMPAPYLSEINRWSDEAPAAAEREYVQWQRGPRTETPLQDMQAWVDTLTTHDNIWLVLVFHGVDGIGWEPMSAQDLGALFAYMKDRESDLWVATFQDVTKYMRERMATTTETVGRGDRVRVELSHGLDNRLYNLSLWLKTYVSTDADSARISGGGLPVRTVPVETDKDGRHVRYDAIPGAEAVEIVLR